METLVATNSVHLDDHALTYQPLRFDAPRWWRRVSRTRVLPWVYGVECLYGGSLLPRSVLTAAKKFEPDAVFTVAGSWHWTALGAERVARALRVPLIASFNDWYDYGWFPAHEGFRAAIERRFRRFYREADLALCTSEGMREALGPHPNAHVLYPMGARMGQEDKYQPKTPSRGQALTVFFGGGLGDWYGPMLESLVVQARRAQAPLQFKIFGSLQTWSEEFDTWARNNGVFGGQQPFGRLAQEAAHSDLLLLPMGFGEDCAQVERTSFKTKFLDYLSFQRPILVWGPEYCSAVRVAREFDSAECITSPDPAGCVSAMERLAADPDRRAQLIVNARRMYEERFHPDKIHAGLVKKIHELCGSSETS